MSYADLAKVSPHVLTPEHFGLHLGTHFVAKYSHINKALVTVEKLRWSRIPVGVAGQERPHPHSFIRDGEDKRTAAVEVRPFYSASALVATRCSCLRVFSPLLDFSVVIRRCH